MLEHYKYGQGHPEAPDIVFYQYKHGIPHWVTKEQFARYHQKTVIRARQRYLDKGASIRAKRSTRYRSDPVYRAGLRTKAAGYALAHTTQKRAYNQRYYKNNITRLRRYQVEYERKRLRDDPYFRVVRNLRRRMALAITNARFWRTTQDIIGCSREALIQHLEQKFSPGMTWANYGTWHIDHIIPCASFNLSVQAEIRTCFNYSNLQPLWATDNIRKGAKMTTHEKSTGEP